MSKLAVSAILALSACAALPPSAPAPAPKVGEAATVPVPPQPSADSCGAKALQWLVGRPKSEIPVPSDPSKRRVACTTCPVTMDYSPWRLNILYDAETGIVKEVKCG